MAAKKEAENQKETNQVDTDVNPNLDQLVESMAVCFEQIKN